MKQVCASMYMVLSVMCATGLTEIRHIPDPYSIQSGIEANTDILPVEQVAYAFASTVSDGLVLRVPEVVGMVIGNEAPVANAGSSRYAGEDAVVLDGRASFDPDSDGALSYSWRQVSGRELVLSDPSSATPTVSGMSFAGRPQHCTFELTVSDGLLQSPPDTTEVIIVQAFGDRYFSLINGPFDPNKPTIVGFGGGNCNTGSGLRFGGLWLEHANFLTVSTYQPPYSLYGDALIAYLSSMAPDYEEMIGTMGFSTGNMPAIDVAIRINTTYPDRRFAVNRVTFLDTACRSYIDNIKEFYDTRLEGEAFWIDNYYSTMGSAFKNVLNIRFPVPPAQHGTPANWVGQSDQLMSFMAPGLNAGFFISVAGPGRHLQIADDVSPYSFDWNPNTDHLVHRNETLYPGRIPQPVTLQGPNDGDRVTDDGVILTCDLDPDAVQYDLLLGPDPWHLVHLVCQTNTPPEDMIQILPYEPTYWTIRTTDAFGSTTYPEPRCLFSDQISHPEIKNESTQKHYRSIQEAIDQARQGDVIVVGPGLYAYGEKINFRGKAITVRSQDPNDPDMVAATMINAGLTGPAVTFNGSEDATSVLSGLTLIHGTCGILCDGASPTISRCVIQDHLGAGIHMRYESRANIEHCLIQGNMGPGIELEVITNARRFLYNYPTVADCTITNNQGGGIVGETPTVVDSTVQDSGE
ncbi:MAG: right-handed parallel beta-helix repeat-containing protein [Phycisphaerae bacterium]|nr:right-handed parallel beta-helix repeat-containing protein [Phycisphaerae bacterium]